MQAIGKINIPIWHCFGNMSSSLQKNNLCEDTSEHKICKWAEWSWCSGFTLGWPCMKLREWQIWQIYTVWATWFFDLWACTRFCLTITSPSWASAVRTWGEVCRVEVMGCLWGAEARVGLAAACASLGGGAGGHGAGNGVAGAAGALQRLLCDDLLQGVLLLYLKDVWLLRLVTDTTGRGRDVTAVSSAIMVTVPLDSINHSSVEFWKIEFSLIQQQWTKMTLNTVIDSST